MPFTLKKQYGASERCITWVEFNGHIYTAVMGSSYKRVYDETGAIIYNVNSSENIHLFKVAGSLFLVTRVNSTNSLQIFKFVSGSFGTLVAFSNSYDSVLDYAEYAGNYYFMASRFVGSTGNGGSGLFKFTGTTLTKIKEYATGFGGRFMRCFDINQSNSDFIIGECLVGLGNGDTKIIKRTQLAVETELIHLTGSGNDIRLLKIFDGLIHYVRQGTNNNLCSLNTFAAGAVETIIASNLSGSYSSSGQTHRAIVYSGFLWLKLFNFVYRYNGTSNSLFDTLTLGLQGDGNFTALVSELIVGAGTKFMTTVTPCDLTLGSPSHTKTDETAIDADDGTITVNATSSFFIQYSTDNIAFQSSNTFINLAPGTYTVYLKDTNGCTSNIPNIEIFPFDEPPDPPDPPVGTNLEINLTPVNEFNFITWFNAIGNTTFNTITSINCVNGLPKPYRLNKPKTINHYPWIVNAEQFSFYINFKSNFSSPNFGSFQLHVIDFYGVVQTNVAPLLRVFDADAVSYFIYANVTLAGLNPGVYRLALVDMSFSPGNILYVSQELKVVTTDQANKKSIRVRFRNSSNVYRFLYESITDFVQQIRLRISVLEENAEGELEQYRAASSGLLRNVNVELDLSVKLEAYYFDDLAHKAMFVFQIDDFIFLNEKAYLVKSLYKPDWGDQSRTTSKGTFEVYDQAFSSSNRYGNTDSIVIVGSDDPLLVGDGGFIKL